MEKLTVSVEEAAIALGISRGSAYAAAKNGELPTLKFGKRLLVPRKVLDRMIEEACERKPAEAVAA